MSFLDFIPTIEEVGDFVMCRIAGHEWLYFEGGRKCKNCGKVE